MDNHFSARRLPGEPQTTRAAEVHRPAAANPLTVVAQSVESLRPEGAPPAWPELIGPEANPTRARWHERLDTLMGFAALGDCHAIASVGYGWARHLDPTGEAEGNTVVAPGERRRCRVVYLLTRSGDTAGYLRAGPEILIDEAPTVGRIPDLARRALGLPTPPPEDSTPSSSAACGSATSPAPTDPTAPGASLGPRPLGSTPRYNSPPGPASPSTPTRSSP